MDQSEFGSMNLKQLIPLSVRKWVRLLPARFPFSVQRRRRRPSWPGEDDRWSYQSRYIDFRIEPGERVLDVGSGGDPFPYATHLVDRYLEPTNHRNANLVTAGRPLVAADLHRLPYCDKFFDFVYCSHVLEHVDDPIETCAEIMRVGKRGFIETPTMGKDILFAWTRHTHKWHIARCGQTLCFFEYSPRQTEGIRSSAWRDIILDSHYHPLQAAFYQNQDIFNVLFTWTDRFSVFVFERDGAIRTLNAEIATALNS
jgi:ubiquinone/menaquinone biosynthesis C-methylase UbiE